MTSYVLLSGGIDSTTTLYIAMGDRSSDVVGISFNYGQRHIREVEHAARSCATLDVEHRLLDLPGIPKTALTDPDAKIPNASYDQILGVSPVYVPFRNGLMLSAIASHVAGCRVEKARDTTDMQGEDLIYFGAHAEDALNWAYPDCTPEFNGAMANAIYVGTYHTVRLITPLQWLRKPDIIRIGQHLGVDWTNTFSCYAGQEMHCGTCPTCRARRQGFKDAGVDDPTEYQHGGD
jgi:7-cyano-7-deazaguanine synthase